MSNDGDDLTPYYSEDYDWYDDTDDEDELLTMQLRHKMNPEDHPLPKWWRGV